MMERDEEKIIELFRNAIRDDDERGASASFGAVVQGMADKLMALARREADIDIALRTEDNDLVVDLLLRIKQSPGLLGINSDGMQVCAFCGVIGPASGGNHHADTCLIHEIKRLVKLLTTPLGER